MYYKLDLGKADDSNLFQFYDILRNFEYAITVRQIDADGYTTAEAALNGVVYNNFSFDVNTRNMANVSDGDNMLWVNQTTFVVTSPDETTITAVCGRSPDRLPPHGTLCGGAADLPHAVCGAGHRRPAADHPPELAVPAAGPV